MDLITIYSGKQEEKKRREQIMIRNKEEGQDLRIWRSCLHLKQKYVAEQLGTTIKVIRKIESGDVDDEYLLERRAYKILLQSEERNYEINQLRLEVDSLNEKLEKATMIIELNGQRYTVPLSPPRRRSVI